MIQMGGEKNMLLRVTTMVAIVLISVGGASSIAWASPNGRAYEMVSPAYKGGYGVTGGTAVGIGEHEGDAVAFHSVGVFDGLLVGLPTGNQYIAHRNPNGWSTTGLEPPAARALPEGSLAEYDLDFTPTLSLFLWTGCSSPNIDRASQCKEEIYLTHDTSLPSSLESWEDLGVPLVLLEEGLVLASFEGPSADFCHLLLSEGPLIGDPGGTVANLYDMATGCGEAAGTHLVGVSNKGELIEPACSATLGGREENTLNAIAAGGSEIFFTDNVGPVKLGNECLDSPLGSPQQLFVRLGSQRTVEVSRPLGPGAFGGCGDGGGLGETPGEVPCPGATTRPPALYWGASEDGSEAYFTTAAPLAEGDGDNQRDLYKATIGCPLASPGCAVTEREVLSLTQVSASALVSEPADVRGVVKVAPNGSHVAFVAGGVLSEAPGAEGRTAIKGADNLYVYDDATGETRFLASLCSGPGKSGTVGDPRCSPSLHEASGTPDEAKPSQGNDAVLWLSGQETKEAQFNICVAENQAVCQGDRETGRFLIFSSYGQLLEGDTDNSRDVYRYDFAAGALERVSVGEEGADAGGNCDEGSGETVCDATVVTTVGLRNPARISAQRELADRAITEDGSRIVFSSSGPLSPDASNGQENVYEWSDLPGGEGAAVSIVSTGSSATADVAPVITASGRDLFFESSQGLVKQDDDGQIDVYDYRIGGGFASAPVEVERCAGDACKGSLTEAPALQIPGSVSQVPGGNFTPPPAAKPPSIAKKAKHKSRSGSISKREKKRKRWRSSHHARGKRG
jgi:hypothetical protein